MGQRGCKVIPMIGEVCDQHLSTPPKPSINTAVQHPHPRDETPVNAGEGNSQERRVMEKGGEVREVEESGRVQESRKRKKWWRRPSFFRAAKKQPPESSSGQGEVKDEGEKRKVAWPGRSSDGKQHDYLMRI